MPTTATDIFRNLRVDEITEDAQDSRVPPSKLQFLNSLAQVDADNNELFAKHQGRIQIAPMVAMDAKAPVFKAERFSLESNTLQKIKFGTSWSETELRDWIDLASSPMRDPQGIVSGNIVRRTIQKQLDGIDYMKEALAVAMALDGAVNTANYSRMGYILENVTWGRYSDLKRTVTTAWEANPTTATPVKDIELALEFAAERYDETYDTLRLPRAAARAMFATTEYKDRGRPFQTIGLAPNNFSSTLAYEASLFKAITGLNLQYYDARWETQNDDLSWNNYRYWPLNPCPVELRNSADDRNSTVQDMGNGVAMEGLFADARFARDVVSLPASGVHRPVSYAVIPGDLDPVKLTIFSAHVCYPRLYRRSSNMVLNIGTVTETIPVTDLSPA